MKFFSRFGLAHHVGLILVVGLLVGAALPGVATGAPSTGAASRIEHGAQEEMISPTSTGLEFALAAVRKPELVLSSLTAFTSTGEISQVVETGDGCRTIVTAPSAEDSSFAESGNLVVECDAAHHETSLEEQNSLPELAPPAPVLLSPANNSILNTLLPQLRIDARVSNVEISPNIWYSRDPSFGSGSGWVMFCGWNQSSSQFQYSSYRNLVPNARYYWRARSGYGDGCENPNLNWSPWSPTWSFVTGSNGTILPGPQLVSPANGSTVSNLRPTLSWRAVAGATGTRLYGRPIYHINPNEYYSWSRTLSGTATSTQPWYDLTRNETYEWYVEVRNDYAWGHSSSLWRFTIGSPSTISGRVTTNGSNGLSGVTISAGGNRTTTTGNDGRYTLSNLSAGTYTVSAAKAGYTFAPGSRSVTIPPNATNIDFVGTGTYEIAGRITDGNNAGLSGVTISAGARQTTTNSNGNYRLTGLEPGSFIVTPSKSGHAMCPRSRPVTVPPNQMNQDFSASLAGSDLGFCAEPDGFGFANKQLWRTWSMFEQYYGSNQVRKPDGSVCAEAQRYFDQTYRGVANGWSCIGFTLSGLHSYQNRPQPHAGPFAIAHYDRLYDQPESSQLTDSIAYYSGVQLSQQFQSDYRGWLNTCNTNPSQMVERLRQALQSGNSLLLGLKVGSIWHAMLPYRVVSVSSNETHVYVYDSEAPGQQRVVRMQPSGSGWQWQYTFVGSLAYAGTRTGGCGDMVYYQPTTSLDPGAPLVDLCEDTRDSMPESKSEATTTSQMLTVLPATGDWLVQDAAGHRLGWTGGQWVAEIPGGYELLQTFGDAAPANRLLYLPTGSYTIQAGAEANREIDYSLFVDGRVLEVSGQTSSAGMMSEIEVTPGLDAISVTQPVNLTSLVIDMTRERPTSSRMAGFMGSAITGNDDLAMSFDGQEMQLSRAGGSLEYRLWFQQPGASSGYFISEPIALDANEAHLLHPTSWAGLSNSTVILEIDEGRNGTIDETVTLENAAKKVYLPAIAGR